MKVISAQLYVQNEAVQKVVEHLITFVEGEKIQYSDMVIYELASDQQLTLPAIEFNDRTLH